MSPKSSGNTSDSEVAGEQSDGCRRMVVLLYGAEGVDDGGQEHISGSGGTVMFLEGRISDTVVYQAAESRS